MPSPLFLTLLRVLIGPLFVFVYLYPKILGLPDLLLPWVLLGLLLVSEMSDFFDGFLARRWNKVSDLGKILDPMADTIFRLSVFFAFTQGEIALPLFFPLLLFIRDAVISYLRTLCALKGVVLAARLSGKLKAILQGCATFAMLILFCFYTHKALSLEKLQLYSFWMMWVVTVYTLFSGLEYIMAHYSFINRVWKNSTAV